MTRFDNELWPNRPRPSGPRKALRAAVIALVAGACGALGAFAVMSEMTKSDAPATAAMAPAPASTPAATVAPQPETVPAAPPKLAVADAKPEISPAIKTQTKSAMRTEPPVMVQAVAAPVAAWVAAPPPPALEPAAIAIPNDADLTFAKGYARRRAAASVGDRDATETATVAPAAAEPPVKKPAKPAQRKTRRPSPPVGEVVELPDGRRVMMPSRYGYQQQRTDWSFNNVFGRWQ